MGGIRFSCAGYVGGYFFLWIEDSCVRDSISDAYIGVLYWYISVGFGILMEVGELELGIGLLYSFHTPVWYTHVLTFEQVVHPVTDGEKTEGNHTPPPHYVQCIHNIVVYSDGTYIIGGLLFLRCGIYSSYI